MGNTNEHILTNIHQLKYIKGYILLLYPYVTEWEKGSTEIIHIFGARAIFLLFYDNQDTENEYQEI